MKYLYLCVLILMCHTSYCGSNGIRFYIEKDLSQIILAEQSVELEKKELLRLLDLCQTNFSSYDTTTAKVYYQLSDLSYDNRSFKDALQYKQLEVDVHQHNNDLKKLATSYTSMGKIYRWLSKFYKAEEYHLKSLEVKRQIPDHTYYENYVGLCHAYYQIGKYNLQKQYASYAVEIARTSEELCNANVHMVLGHARLKELDEGYELLAKIKKIAEKEKLEKCLGTVYTNLGWLNQMEQDKLRRAWLKEMENDKKLRHKQPYSYTEAIELYKKGIAIKEKTDDPFMDRDLAYQYSSLSNLYVKVMDYEKAIFYANVSIEKASKFYRKGHHPDMGTLYANRAYKYLTRYNINRKSKEDVENEILEQDLDLGIKNQEEAIKCFVNNPNLADPIEDVRQADLYGMDLKWRCIKSYRDIAISYAHKYLFLGKDMKNLVMAEKSQSKVIDLIDIMREEMSDQDTKIFWRKDTRNRYNDAVELSEWIGDINKVIYYIEKSKSILLLDELNHKDALKLIPAHLSERERKLREYISTNDTKKPYYYNLYNNFLDSLALAYPAYHTYKFASDPPSLGDIQAEILDDSTHLVMYYMTHDSLYTVNITSTESELLHTKKPAHIDSLVNKVLALVNNKDSLEYMSCYKDFLGKSHELYNLLYAPIINKKKNAIIIGDGIIDFIPFDLLAKDTVTKHPHYLIQDHIFSYASSVSVLKNKKMKDKNNFNNMLMVCPQRFEGLGLTSLVQSRHEIDALKNICNSTILEDKDASVENFILHSAGYDVIHFSSHSGLDRETKQPWIACQDSLINLNEIYKLNLNASLVTLSSCKSSDGDYQSGEGINSLARAFLFADASAVVGSLWDLNEVSGLSIFDRFYNNLKTSCSKPEALRKAKLEFIENNPYKSPYHWAPLICIGNPDSLQSTFSTGLPYMFLFFMLLVVVSFIGYKLIFKKKD